MLSVISVLGINFIPLEMYLYRDFNIASVMVTYAVENALGIVFATLLVFVFAPASEENLDFPRRAELLKQYPPFPIDLIRKKAEILRIYLIFSLGCTVVSAVFLAAFIYVALKSQIQFRSVGIATLWIAGFQFIEFLASILLLRPLTLAKSEVYLKNEMGRVALLFLSIFLGIFLAAIVDSWFFVPFILLKTMADIGFVIQGLRINNKT